MIIFIPFVTGRTFSEFSYRVLLSHISLLKFLTYKVTPKIFVLTCCVSFDIKNVVFVFVFFFSALIIVFSNQHVVINHVINAQPELFKLVIKTRSYI